MRDVCQKWKVKLSRRLKQFDGLTRLILTPAPSLRQIYVTGHPSQIHRDDPPLAVPGEPFQGIIVTAEIHTERSAFASRPEPEVTRPEVEIAPVAHPSFGSVAAVDSRSQSV